MRLLLIFLLLLACLSGTSPAFAQEQTLLPGDGEVTARVTSIENTNPLAKAGVMIRETLEANSKNAAMLITPSNGAFFQKRMKTGGKTAIVRATGITAPYWVRLSRHGNTFTGSISSDGAQWTVVGNARIVMAGTVYAGFAVSSHNNAVLCAAQFDQWSITQ